VIEDDFLLRQIRELVRAVVQAKDEDDEAALAEAIANGLRTLCGLSADVLTKLAPDAVAPLISVDGIVERTKGRAIAALLLEDAETQLDPGVAHGRRVAAVGLLALGGVEGTDELTHLDEVVRRIHLGALHPTTLARLVPIFETAGRYDRAEDVVFAWFDLQPEPAFAAGVALYERLWALPDARLRAGGLSSDEVLESLGDLQRRAGRS
jgi:hypothetical protein